jgi:phosphate transport system ATP-binding protein
VETPPHALSHVSVRNLNVWYGSDHVLKGISIDIPDNSITTIIGPSGCGKTTLLKSLNRLLDITEGARVEGEVFVDGENILAPGVDETELRRRMGLLSQRPSPLPMSIYDNIAFGPRVHGTRKRATLDAIVEKNLVIAGLWDEVKDRLSTPAARLSIGQQQRLCLARALAVEPEILLGDEPTSALDPRSTRNIEERFRELKSRYAIVIVTHILRQARRLADYVIFMYMGELVEHGPAREVLENPRHELTREYIQGVIS